MTLWKWYQPWLERELNSLGFSLEKAKSLRKAILELSDLYQKTQVTPWDRKSTQAAYLSYFMPLNLLRSQAVFEIFKTQGPPLSESVRLLDFGSGAGTTDLSLSLSPLSKLTEVHALEISPTAIKLHQSLNHEIQKHFGSPKWKTHWNKNTADRYDIGVFQTSLNEINTVPDQLWECDHLILIEAATSEKARPLMQLRESLIQKGYFLWAPCTHQLNCPLLLHSQKDWCHDKVLPQAPPWFDSLALPIQNKELSFSYLIASRTSPSADQYQKARVVGDPLWEKGKLRQMVCQNDQRQFLSWLRRKGDPTPPHRGDLISAEELAVDRSEIRVNGEIKTLWSRYSSSGN